MSQLLQGIMIIGYKTIAVSGSLTCIVKQSNILLREVGKTKFWNSCVKY